MDAIAIADANKIRAAMGLPPLPVPGGGDSSSLQFKESINGDADSYPEDITSTLDKRSAAAGSNWAKLEAERQEKIERQKRKEAAKKARDKAAQSVKLAGRGLGDLDEGEGLDTKSWLLGQKKRQKKIEKQRAQEQERERVEKARQQEYSSKDLAGIKVGHSADGFGDGEQILTLKDAEIGSDDEDEDELENAELVEKEKLQEKLELKKKRPIYDPNEVSETGERTILGHYDEEISGKKRKRFTLDEQGGGQKQEQKQDLGQGNGIRISLDELMDDKPVSDYAEYKEAKIRKPKKQKKQRTTRQREVEEDEAAPVQQDGDTAMDLGEAPTNGASKRFEVEIDDEDLQTQLAMQRRLALKKRKKLDAAELARQIRSTSEQPDPTTQDSDGEPGLVIDETREFVSHLKRDDSDSDTPRARRRSSTAAHAPTHEDPDADMPDADLTGATIVHPSRSRSPSPSAPVQTSTGLENEDTTSSLGSVASMLRKRGLISDTASSESAKRSQHDREYADFLAANRRLISEFDAKARQDRERDRERGVFNSMSNVQRQEYSRKENERREAYLSRLQAEHFSRNYKPEVKLEYHDEFGREMNAKEAFKHMSHQFHGKGSGKGKQEKRLKKIEDEKRREGRGLLEEGGRGMGNVAREQGKRRGVAGVRLQ
ncbi:U4/U6.U5 tri-snRNP-associated protein snu66-like protein [Elsinoe fawcettii]|nr:U4/U6.U5 tri-snRNP-associated protein snu66-like protein [Elsinoe fawcettii]